MRLMSLSLALGNVFAVALLISLGKGSTGFPIYHVAALSGVVACLSVFMAMMIFRKTRSKQGVLLAVVSVIAALSSVALVNTRILPYEVWVKTKMKE